MYQLKYILICSQLKWDISLAMTNNFSNHLCIIVHLIPPKKYEGPIPHLGLVILFVILLTVLETLGNFLLLCIICYEKYGMDSKKRTVTNMLLSRMIFVQILCNIFTTPLPTIGQIFGVYSEYFLFPIIHSIYNNACIF